MEGFDAVVVGSGASGGWAAKQLSEAGLSVLVLEAGDVRSPADLPPAGEALDRSAASLAESAARQPIQSRHGAFGRQNRGLFVDDLDNPYGTADDRPFDWIRSRQLGGRTLVWGGVTLRFTAEELAGWPVSLDELLPYYQQVESFLGVRGDLPMTAAELLLDQAIAGAWPGQHLTMARGVSSATAPGAWPSSTAQGSTLAAAARTGRVTIKTGAVVCGVESDERGTRAAAVVFIDRGTGRRERVAAGLVFLCASTIESTRILLCSASARHPRGLGNGSGALGCYLMDHPSIGVSGRLPELPPPATVEPFGGPHSVCLPNVRSPHGYLMMGGAQRRHPAIADALSRFIFHASSEMRPDAENRVTLDSQRTDAWGLPIAHIDCRLSQHEHALLADAREALHQMMARAGFIIEHEDPASTPGGWVHEVGTARMGGDPSHSVLNGFNQCWEIENLFVTDGAAFASSGCRNPTLTMMALTVRACDYALSTRSSSR